MTHKNSRRYASKLTRSRAVTGGPERLEGLDQVLHLEHDRSLAETSKALRHLGELLAVAGKLERLGHAFASFAGSPLALLGDRFGVPRRRARPCRERAAGWARASPSARDFCQGKS